MKAAPLTIPEAILRQHTVVFGKTGAGKSSVLRHLVEHLLAAHKRVCVIDPKGDWWGLPSSADGKSAGFKVLLFGDFKGREADIPMDARAGKEVARIIATSDQPCVLGFRGWMPGDLTTFWINFASALFNHNRGELYLVIDEVHNFAPKGKIMDVNAGKCLHWTNRLASEGRGLGLKLMIASQRPQKVHNDTASCCETLIAMRVVHPRDREAIDEWVNTNAGDTRNLRPMLAQIPSMAVGEGWVWFPDGGYLEKIKFPMFRTFDSFSEHATNAPTEWARVDVAAAREQLARVVKEKDENDPRRLRERIRQLESSNSQQAQQIATLMQQPECTETLSPDEFEQLCMIRRELESAMRYAKLIDEILASVRDAAKTAPKPAAFLERPSPRAMPSFERRAPNGNAPSGGKRRMMIALAQRPGLTRRQLGLRAGLSSTSGTFGTYLSELRKEGYLQSHGEHMGLTPEGVEALGSFDPLPTGRALCDYWIGEVGGGAARMLEALTENPGVSLSREELGAAANISHTSGTFGTYLSRLRTLELITKGFPVSASEELFD